jgi:hypothetical protein
MTITAARLAGIPKEAREIAKRYITAFDAAGIPPDKVDRLIAWGVDYRGTAEELVPAFRAQVQRLGITGDLAQRAENNGLYAWQGGDIDVQRDGLTGEDARLEADIRQYARNYPREYEQDKEMQAVRLSLIEKGLNGGASPPVEPPKGFDRDLRLKEIRAISRDDPDRYNSSPELQQERLSLIEQQMASEQPAAAPAPAATPQAGSE